MQSSDQDNNSHAERVATEPIRKKRSIRDGMLFKINIPIAAVLVVGISVWSYFHIDFQGRMLTNNIINNAEQIGKIINYSLNRSMMENAGEDVENILARYGSLRDVRNVRIINKAGKVMFSNDARQIGEYVHLSDPVGHP
jgi:histidine kinase